MVRTDFSSIPYSVDSRTAPGLRNAIGEFTITQNSDPLGAIRAAFQEWNHVPSSEVTFAAIEISASVEPRNDGVNVITFADTPTTRSLVGDASRSRSSIRERQAPSPTPNSVQSAAAFLDGT